MEESKELQGFYKIFRAVVYVSVLLEFFEYAIDPAVFDQWGGILTDIHGRIKRWTIYQDGHLVYSKIATILLICITCIGTRNKKHLEFDARKSGALSLGRRLHRDACVHLAVQDTHGHTFLYDSR
jgi:hypothetical protein